MQAILASRNPAAERRPLEERFWEKVDKTPTCWLFQAAVTSNGYGHFSVGGRAGGRRRAHRVAWELTFGPIPDGLFVLHRCDTRLCVNPTHLFLGTLRETTQDMWSKGRANYQRMRRVAVEPMWWLPPTAEVHS